MAVILLLIGAVLHDENAASSPQPTEGANDRPDCILHLQTKEESDMRRLLSELWHLTAHATDGEVGKVTDVLFDDDYWTVRYLVVNTGGLFNRQEVLIPPRAVRSIDIDGHRLLLDLNKEKVAAAPPTSSDKPISKQEEVELYGHYGFPIWNGLEQWGIGPMKGPFTLMPEWERSEATGDPNLRSGRVVIGYRAHAMDGALGDVVDFIVDDQTLTISYFVVDTSAWWFGKKVLIAPMWCSELNWIDHSFNIVMTREAVKAAPEWTPARFVDAEYDDRLRDHHKSRLAGRASSPHQMRP